MTVAAFLLIALTLDAQRGGAPMPLPQGDEAQIPSPTHADLVYAIADGQKLRLDVYEPRKHTSPTPGIVLIHGGGFTNFDRSLMDGDASKLAHAGFVAFSIDYRLLAKSPSCAECVALAIAGLPERRAVDTPTCGTVSGRSRQNRCLRSLVGRTVGSAARPD